ncbi:MAG TPA: methyltransferase domain-containing protein [Fimbriimonadaceae bacterium]|nr:methyltransferase domain-containing protein [Fimbriimonadaceae bacterium]HRJ95163.1 methyltransferase domain-containing protein [Fimbriimonadaceae bacterium]
MELPFAQLSFPEIYEQYLVAPLFRPLAGPLLEEVELRLGDRLLDVACGTGVVARVAKEHLGETGKVVGIDISPGMLAIARREAHDIEWREGDACSLPLQEGEQFDAVVCQQGLQFFPDRPAAVREMRRAMAIGGRLAVSTWRPDEEFPVLLELRRVAERHLGAIVDLRHCLGQETIVESLLEDAGFKEVRSNTFTQTLRFGNGVDFVRLNTMALVGMAAASKELTDDERTQVMEAIANDSAEVVHANTDQRGFTFEIGTNVVTARS